MIYFFQGDISYVITSVNCDALNFQEEICSLNLLEPSEQIYKTKFKVKWHNISSDKVKYCKSHIK